MKRLTLSEYYKLYDSFEGRIVEFKEGLLVGLYAKNSVVPKYRVKTPVRFMRATGGFGCYKTSMGRMVIGSFFESLKDAQANNVIEYNGCTAEGNTKNVPDFVYVEEVRE